MMARRIMAGRRRVASDGLITDGLVSRWALNELSGTAAHDSQGENHGLISGDVTLTGDYAVFGGVNSKIEIGSNPTGIPTGAIGQKLTITMEVKVASIPTDGKPEGLLSYTENYDIRLEDPVGAKIGDRLWLRTYGDNNGGSTAAAVTAGQWAKLAVAWDVGTGAFIYINGTLDSTSTFADTSVESSTLQLGDSANVSTTNFAGSMRDVRIYDRILSASEIASIANGEG